MDKQKKQELAEKDSRWKFKKKVKISEGLDLDWDDVRTRYNTLQEKHGDLHMTIAKRDKPEKHKVEQLKNWYNQRFADYDNSVVFHHSQVYYWYEKLADALDVDVAKAVEMLFDDLDGIRDNFDLENSLVINNIDAMDQSGLQKDSQVDRDDLEAMIDNE